MNHIFAHVTWTGLTAVQSLDWSIREVGWLWQVLNQFIFSPVSKSAAPTPPFLKSSKANPKLSSNWVKGVMIFTHVSARVMIFTRVSARVMIFTHVSALQYRQAHTATII